MDFKGRCFRQIVGNLVDTRMLNSLEEYIEIWTTKDDEYIIKPGTLKVAVFVRFIAIWWRQRALNSSEEYIEIWTQKATSTSSNQGL